jgi:hypothetical protein
MTRNLPMYHTSLSWRHLPALSRIRARHGSLRVSTNAVVKYYFQREGSAAESADTADDANRPKLLILRSRVDLCFPECGLSGAQRSSAEFGENRPFRRGTKWALQYQDSNLPHDLNILAPKKGVILRM